MEAIECLDDSHCYPNAVERSRILRDGLDGANGLEGKGFTSRRLASFQVSSYSYIRAPLVSLLGIHTTT